MKIKITKDQYSRAVKFASERVGKSASLYKYRGESKVDKMIEDIIVGTVGEFAAATYLRSKGLDCSRPDLKIYEAKRKSFDQDLIVEKDDQVMSIHVKSQSVESSKRYGNSWLLQKSDKIVKNPDKSELFLFTEVDGRDVEILGVVRCLDIIEHELLDECRVPWYRHSKFALYFKDIKEELSDKKLWRL